jgi:hypothetical protein
LPGEDFNLRNEQRGFFIGRSSQEGLDIGCPRPRIFKWEKRMKILIPILVSVILVVGCASNSPPPAVKTQPHVGMTKEEVLKNYGQPGHIIRTDEGEMWQYDNLMMAAIPFNFGFKPKFHRFSFDKDGLVTKFSVEDF